MKSTKAFIPTPAASTGAAPLLSERSIRWRRVEELLLCSVGFPWWIRIENHGARWRIHGCLVHRARGSPRVDRPDGRWMMFHRPVASARPSRSVTPRPFSTRSSASSKEVWLGTHVSVGTPRVYPMPAPEVPTPVGPPALARTATSLRGDTLNRHRRRAAERFVPSFRVLRSTQ